MQHVSDLHPKFAAWPHYVYCMVDIQSPTAANSEEKEEEERTRIAAATEIRRGKKEERRKKQQDKNVMSASATQSGHRSYLMPLCTSTESNSVAPPSEFV